MYSRSRLRRKERGSRPEERKEKGRKKRKQERRTEGKRERENKREKKRRENRRRRGEENRERGEEKNLGGERRRAAARREETRRHEDHVVCSPVTLTSAMSPAPTPMRGLAARMTRVSFQPPMKPMQKPHTKVVNRWMKMLTWSAMASLILLMSLSQKRAGQHGVSRGGASGF